MQPEPQTFKELKELFASIYLIEDPYIIKVLLASYLSHIIATDPAWIVIVAPSGGLKSELINALSTSKYVHALSTLTPTSFISGAKMRGGSTASLLLNLSKDTDQEQSGIIAFKDMTSILSEHKDTRAVLMAQMREIYDGKYGKAYGTGEKVEWMGKVTIIAGATYAIYEMRQKYAQLGERFLFYNFIQPDRIQAGLKSMENQESGEIKAKRELLASAIKHYLEESIKIPKDRPTLTTEFKYELLSLAELATRSRSSVERNWASREQEITEVHPPEMPTRFAGSLQSIAIALMVLNWNETNEPDLRDEDKMILNKLALDSITKVRRTTMRELAKYDIITTAGLAVKLGMPTNTVRRWLEDLTALEVAEREKGSGNQGDQWKIKNQYRLIMEKFEGVDHLGGTLTEEFTEPSEETSLENKLADVF